MAARFAEGRAVVCAPQVPEHELVLRDRVSPARPRLPSGPAAAAAAVPLVACCFNLLCRRRVDDAVEFAGVCKAMTTIGFGAAEQAEMFGVLR